MTRARLLPRDPVSAAGVVAAAVLAGALVLLFGWAAAGGFGAPPGPAIPRVDFAAFWGAGRLAWAGRPADAYSWPRLAAELSAAFGRPVGAPLPFFYPPMFLLLVDPLGALSYRTAFAVWAGAGLGAYALAAAAALRRPGAVLTALAAPGVLCCVYVGQNGLLTAGALMAGLAMLPRRPGVAGCLLAFLAVKPQLALLLPAALALDRRWRALATCAATTASLAGISALVLGPQVVSAFLRAAGAGGSSFAEAGWLSWSKVQSVYGAARAAGLEPGPALAAHTATALAASAVVLAVCRRRDAAFALKAASLAAGSLLVTPYVFIYDTPLLGVAAVFLLRDAAERGGVTLGQAGLAAAAYLGPFDFYFQHDPWVGPPAAAGCLALIFVRAFPRRAGEAAVRHGVAA